MLASPISTRVLAGIAVLITAAGLLFASVATYARRESVAGWVTPDSGLIRVTARQGGVVDQVKTIEGAVVGAGSALAIVRLSTDTERGDTGHALAESLAAQGTASSAELKANVAKLDGQRRELIARRALLQQQLTEAEVRVDVLQKRQKLAEGEVDRLQVLLPQGYVTRTAIDNLHVAALSSAQDASAARAQQLDLRRQISDLSQELDAIPANIDALIAQTAEAHASLAERGVSAHAQSVFVATAPLSGRVVAVPVERGQALAAGSAVAVMIPKDSTLIAELYVPSRAVGFIRPGQEVLIHYQAFPYQTFGSARAHVASVSRTVLAPSEVAIPGIQINEPVFRVRAQLDRQIVDAYGHAIPIQPGMLLSADVILDRRNLIQWLLDPLYAVGRRA